MTGANIITLVSLVLSPVSALTAVWLTSELTAKRGLRDQQERARADAMAALGRFMAVSVDAEPTLIATNDLREYETPDEAVAGLYARWAAAREPLVLLSVSHPSADVRGLAFKVQAELELSLRQTSHAISGNGDVSLARSTYEQMSEHLGELAQQLSPFTH